MASCFIDKACIDCGKVRAVRRIDVERKKALRCRSCNAKHSVNTYIERQQLAKPMSETLKDLARMPIVKRQS